MNLKIRKNERPRGDPSERERHIAASIADARRAKSSVEAYWRRMRAYYDGTHDTARQTGEFLASLDLPWTPCTVPDGYMHVESQIEAAPPDFTFSAGGKNDGSLAAVRERVVRYAVQNGGLADKNAVNERRLNLYGSAVWKLGVGRAERGEAEIVIENPPPQTVFPDPCAATVDDCEYIAFVYRMSVDRGERLFRNDLRPLGTTVRELAHLAHSSRKKGISAEEDSIGETAEITEFWFRQPSSGEETVTFFGDSGEESVTYRYEAGDIALSLLIEGREVRYIPKFYTKTACKKYPIVLYGKIPSDDSIWGKSELEQIIPLIDAADRQLTFAELNTAFFANDILVYEENAFAPDSYPENRPGAIWKLRPGMADKVKRLGGLASENVSHYEIAEKYRGMMKDALGNYDFMQGDSSTRVTTATGLALLGDYASRRMQAKNIGKKAGFERLYRLMDYMALELFDGEKVAAITDGEDFYSYESVLRSVGYVPELDIAVKVGEDLQNARSFTLSALSELSQGKLEAENYPIIRAYINALGIPERASLVEALDQKFAKGGVTADA